jgi:penicillin amidase
MLSIQLDDRAVFLDRWRNLLLELLTPAATLSNPRRSELRRQLEQWGGHAEVNSVGYRLVRDYRLAVRDAVFGAITAACRRADPQFRFVSLLQSEGPLWQLVSERPIHLLDPRYPSWQALLLTVADRLLEQIDQDYGRNLARRTWGEKNTVHIRHPLSRALPLLGAWLDLPPTALPGDLDMPRVQTTINGASQRLAVSPGHEAEGYFHMPGGQSGHPLSPFYRAGHEAWLRGEPTAFLPGPARHTLALNPGH